MILCRPSVMKPSNGSNRWVICFSSVSDGSLCLFEFAHWKRAQISRLGNSCWQKSPKFLCISKRINKDQGICCKQRKPHDLRAFWLCCRLPAWLWRRCQWWDSSDWKCVSTNIRGNRQKIILSVFLWVWCASPTELRENQTLKGPVSLHWLQNSPWENQLTWRPLSWRSLTLEKLTSSFCCLQWKYPHMTVLKTANGLPVGAQFVRPSVGACFRMRRNTA